MEYLYIINSHHFDIDGANTLYKFGFTTDIYQRIKSTSYTTAFHYPCAYCRIYCIDSNIYGKIIRVESAIKQQLAIFHSPDSVGTEMYHISLDSLIDIIEKYMKSHKIAHIVYKNLADIPDAHIFTNIASHAPEKKFNTNEMALIARYPKIFIQVCPMRLARCCSCNHILTSPHELHIKLASKKLSIFMGADCFAKAFKLPTSIKNKAIIGKPELASIKSLDRMSFIYNIASRAQFKKLESYILPCHQQDWIFLPHYGILAIIHHMRRRSHVYIDAAELDKYISAVNKHHKSVWQSQHIIICTKMNGCPLIKCGNLYIDTIIRDWETGILNSIKSLGNMNKHITFPQMDLKLFNKVTTIDGNAFNMIKSLSTIWETTENIKFMHIAETNYIASRGLNISKSHYFAKPNIFCGFYQFAHPTVVFIHEANSIDTKTMYNLLKKLADNAAMVKQVVISGNSLHTKPIGVGNPFHMLNRLKFRSNGNALYKYLLNINKFTSISAASLNMPGIQFIPHEIDAKKAQTYDHVVTITNDDARKINILCKSNKYEFIKDGYLPENGVFPMPIYYRGMFFNDLDEFDIINPADYVKSQATNYYWMRGHEIKRMALLLPEFTEMGTLRSALTIAVGTLDIYYKDTFRSGNLSKYIRTVLDLNKIDSSK